MASKPYRPPQNDNLTKAFEAADLVPKGVEGSAEFLDVVCWNIRYFHDKDPARVDLISDVLGRLNADIFVLEEILEGSLDGVIDRLASSGAGNYSVTYGSTGGQQRVAFLWDLDWIRAKDSPGELFGKGNVLTADGKDAFPRLPLWTPFTGIVDDSAGDPFDFQLLGLHLKSQRGGGHDQRRVSAERLAVWLEREAPKVDTDVILLGDWNEPPNSDTWAAMHRLEKEGKLLFTGINDASDISHLYYKNKSSLGSRLDLIAMTATASKQLPTGQSAIPIKWAKLEDVLKGASMSTQEIKALFAKISEHVSDHLPVSTRFYFGETPQVKPKKTKPR